MHDEDGDFASDADEAIVIALGLDPRRLESSTIGTERASRLLRLAATVLILLLLVAASLLAFTPSSA